MSGTLLRAMLGAAIVTALTICTAGAQPGNNVADGKVAGHLLAGEAAVISR